MATQAQIDANRKNADRSTGPTSPLGKSVSRANAFKHGLAGNGVVVHPDESGEVEARAHAFERQLHPGSEMARAFVHRAAVLSVRVDRCALQEMAAISIQGRLAEQGYDDRVEREVEATFDGLAGNPLVHLRKLARTEGGVCRLILAWSDLKSDLDNGLWSIAHAGRLANLLGHRAEECHAEPYLDLSEAMMGVDNPDRRGRSRTIRPESRCGWARAELSELINSEIAGLEAALDEIDPAQAARDRRDQVTLARLAPTPELLLLRKYEAAAERSMLRALKEARQLDADPAPADLSGRPGPRPSDPNPYPPTTSGKLASFPPGPPDPPSPFELEPDEDTTPLNDAERAEVNEFLAQFGSDYAHLIRENGKDGEPLTPAAPPR